MDLKIFEKAKKNLQKQDEIFIVSDFDDTIFSTKEIIEKDVREGRRWEEWNIFIKENIWYKNFVKEFYEWKDFPKTIIKNFWNNDLILTAWDEELQKLKIKATWLKNINLKVVKKASEKPFEMIKYIFENLKFLPKEIHIYEDRPEFFLETKKEIEDFLNIKIKIFLVKMKDNFSEIKIKEIKKNLEKF